MTDNIIKAEFRTEAFYQAYKPDPDLRCLINEFWIMHLDKVAEHTKPELELPDLFPEIIFKYGEDYEEFRLDKNNKYIRSDSNITGICSYAKASKRVNLNNNLLMIGVKFEPMGLFALLKRPIYEFYNSNIPLKELNEPKLIELEEKLYDQKNRNEILNILNSEFKAIFNKNGVPANSFKFINELKRQNANSFHQILKENQYNYKYLERNFKKYIGVNPKQYFKLKQFINFYMDWLEKQNHKYIDLVFKHNYYDQNHLIKEFKAKMNVSPSKFLKCIQSNFTQHITKAHQVGSVLNFV